MLTHFKATKAVFGGHDFGGAAVQMLALSKPELVAGLLLINTPILPRLHYLVNFDEEQQKLSEHTIGYMAYREGDDKDVVAKTSPILDPVRRDEIRRHLTASPMHGMMSLYRRNYPGPPYGHSKDTSSLKFQVPSLIIWGTNDRCCSTKFQDDLTAHFIAPLRLVTIPEASHWSFYDQLNKVTKEMISWLKTLES